MLSLVPAGGRSLFERPEREEAEDAKGCNHQLHHHHHLMLYWNL
jgi:hypothetical protein